MEYIEIFTGFRYKKKEKNIDEVQNTRVERRIGMSFSKRRKISLICLLCIVVLAVGCTPAKRPLAKRPLTENRNTVDRNRDLYDDNIQRVPDNTVRQSKNITGDANRKSEDHAAREVKKLDKVRDATVIINNNVAYVGIDLTPGVENAETDTIKKEVIRCVERVEPAVTRVYVSADVDVMGRLRGYARDIRAGKPVSGLINEIQEMFRRPIPRT
jgi:YhcN/YlaJ family sporulation lipoprotein